MDFTTSDFDYILPRERIAQAPMTPREAAKLLILHKDSGALEHRRVSDFPEYLRFGDVLVVNNSKVFKARLHGVIRDSEKARTIELFLVRPRESGVWQAIGKPGRKLRVGTQVVIAPDFAGTILEKHTDGTLLVHFRDSEATVIEKANAYGDVPIPPYIKAMPAAHTYQTAYAKIVGSVAAPTAGFHLTPSLLSQVRELGVTVVEITLHVGLGTFLPMKSDRMSDHVMHSEWVDVSAQAAGEIMQAKKQGRRVVAVGTTTVRTLEGIAARFDGTVIPYRGDINLFITPGFSFRITDALLTNFHLPKSTLLVLVSAFAGRERILAAYNEAIARDYRFFSFGDAMFISSQGK